MLFMFNKKIFRAITLLYLIYASSCSMLKTVDESSNQLFWKAAKKAENCDIEGAKKVLRDSKLAKLDFVTSFRTEVFQYEKEKLISFFEILSIDDKACQYSEKNSTAIKKKINCLKYPGAIKVFSGISGEGKGHDVNFKTIEEFKITKKYSNNPRSTDSVNYPLSNFQFIDKQCRLKHMARLKKKRTILVKKESGEYKREKDRLMKDSRFLKCYYKHEVDKASYWLNQAVYLANDAKKSSSRNYYKNQQTIQAKKLSKFRKLYNEVNTNYEKSFCEKSSQYFND